MAGFARKSEIPTICDVTLAHADPDILLCWEIQVKEGNECCLLQQLKGGKMTTTLKSTSFRKLDAKNSKPDNESKPLNAKTSHSENQSKPLAEVKKSKKQNLKKLLTYQQRLVVEKQLLVITLCLMCLSFKVKYVKQLVNHKMI